LYKTLVLSSLHAMALMTPRSARIIADGLTWARVASAVPLTILALNHLVGWFSAVYVVAAFTDAFDGMFARNGTTVRYGGELDGLADVFFAIMTLLWIFLLIPGFYQHYWFPYLPAFAIIQGFLFYARINEPGLTLPHLEFGRFSVFLFNTLLPVLIVAGGFVYLVFTCSIAAKLQLVRHVAGRQQIVDVH
jgi:phosphatidylglycerophosphate synthase